MNLAEATINAITGTPMETNLDYIKNIKELPNEQGVCPFCNGHLMNYGKVEFEGDMAYFPWECEECGHRGEEWYELNFAGHSVYDENDDLIELNEAKKITEDKETERYRPVALLDGENSYKIDRIIMLNNKHTSDELQAAIGKAKEDRAEEIREYGDDWEYITEELDKNGFDWYEIAVNGIEEVYY